MGRTFKDDLLADHQQTFSRTSEFGEAAVYYPANGTPVDINVCVLSNAAPIQQDQAEELSDRELVVSVDNDATTGIASPQLGDALELESEPDARWDFVSLMDSDHGANVIKFQRRELQTLRPAKLNAGR